MARTADQETPLQVEDKAPHDEIAIPEPSIPSVEDILQRFLAIEIVSKGMAGEERRNGESDLHRSEFHTSCDRVPEKILREARRILRSMVTRKASRERTGRDPLADN